MRNSFISELCMLAEARDDIFLLCGDLGYSVLEQFSEKFPDRFMNVGVSEQNMTQVAAGLAHEGYNVFTYSIGNFPTLRCLEQVRQDVCYHKANVKIVAVGAGYAYGSQGVSHHATEDIAILRALPEMVVCAPADPIEARAIAEYMAAYHGPAYVRLNKAGEACVHNDKQPLRMNPEQPILVREGTNAAVLCTGAILHAVLQELQSSNCGWALYSVPFIGGNSSSALIDLSRRFGRLITVEEHQLDGGFGSAIVEQFNDLYANSQIENMPLVHRIAIPNTFIGISGSQDYLRRCANLSLADLINRYP